MMLHEELRKARKEAGLTQEALAAMAGIPRNQVARAERGENITLDTLRKIAVNLPVSNLSLLDITSLHIDVIPQAEKIYYGAMATVSHLANALAEALLVAGEAITALEQARKSNPLPDGSNAIRGGDVELLTNAQQALGTVVSIVNDPRFGLRRKPEAGNETRQIAETA